MIDAMFDYVICLFNADNWSARDCESKSQGSDDFCAGPSSITRTLATALACSRSARRHFSQYAL